MSYIFVSFVVSRGELVFHLVGGGGRREGGRGSCAGFRFVSFRSFFFSYPVTALY